MELFHTKMPATSGPCFSHLPSTDVDRLRTRPKDFDPDVADLFRTAGTRIGGSSGLADTFCTPRRELTYKPNDLLWESFGHNARAAATDPDISLSVVLVYQGNFSPFTKQHARVLSTARRALETTFTHARVVGCLIVPHRDAVLDFDVRDKVIQHVLKLDDVAPHTRDRHAWADWVHVDSCRLGCLAQLTRSESVVPYVAVYAGKRLLQNSLTLKVVTLRHEDPLFVRGALVRQYDALRVSAAGCAKYVPTGGLREANHVVIEEPHSSLLMEQDILDQCFCKDPELDWGERFLGESAFKYLSSVLRPTESARHRSAGYHDEAAVPQQCGLIESPAAEEHMICAPALLPPRPPTTPIISSATRIPRRYCAPRSTPSPSSSHACTPPSSPVHCVVPVATAVAPKRYGRDFAVASMNTQPCAPRFSRKSPFVEQGAITWPSGFGIRIDSRGHSLRIDGSVRFRPTSEVTVVHRGACLRGAWGAHGGALRHPPSRDVGVLGGTPKRSPPPSVGAHGDMRAEGDDEQHARISTAPRKLVAIVSGFKSAKTTRRGVTPVVMAMDVPEWKLKGHDVIMGRDRNQGKAWMCKNRAASPAQRNAVSYQYV